MQARQEITCAISIRQPYIEFILRGMKKYEYRSRPTKIREHVYLYASLSPSKDKKAWKDVGKSLADLPVGVIVGSVEITGCKWDGHKGWYAYNLSSPK